MASFTVTFDDGSSHTYDNVPEHVTDAEVQDRAANEFSGKNITGVVAGNAAPAMEPKELAPAGTGPSIPEKIIGGAQTAGQYLGGTVAEHPLASLGTAAGVAKYKAIKDLVGQGIESMNSNTAARNAKALADLEHQSRMYARAGNTQAAESLRPAIENVRAKLAPPAPAPAPTTAPASSTAAAEGQSFIQRMSTLAKQYAPAAEKVAGQVGRVVAPVARAITSAPAIGAQLGLYSPELNAGEDEWLAEQRRRQGRQ